MARWICFTVLVLLLLIDNITMRIVNDPRMISKRHIGSARDKMFRAKQIPTYQQQQQQNQANLFQRHQQSVPPPDLLLSRWMELYNEQQKVHEPTLLDT